LITREGHTILTELHTEACSKDKKLVEKHFLTTISPWRRLDGASRDIMDRFQNVNKSKAEPMADLDVFTKTLYN
jgi:hypothetical protein